MPIKEKNNEFFNKKFLYITTLCMIYNIDIPFQQNMLLSSGVIYAIENNSIIDTDLEKDVDTLYSKIKGFLDLNKFCLPENFETLCINWY